MYLYLHGDHGNHTDDLLTKACKVLLLPPETLLAGQMSYILFQRAERDSVP